MEDDLDPSQERVDVDSTQVRLAHVDASFQELARVAALGLDVVVGGEAVDPDHLMAVGAQPLGERAADEPGAARDEDSHQALTRWSRGSTDVLRSRSGGPTGTVTARPHEYRGAMAIAPATSAPAFVRSRRTFINSSRLV